MLVEVVCMHCRTVMGQKEFGNIAAEIQGQPKLSCCDKCLVEHHPDAAPIILLGRELNKSKSQKLTFLDNDTEQEVIDE